MEYFPGGIIYFTATRPGNRNIKSCDHIFVHLLQRNKDLTLAQKKLTTVRTVLTNSFYLVDRIPQLCTAQS